MSCQTAIGNLNYIMKSQIERSDINEENLPITFISRFLNLENEIKALEEAQIDGLHFDVMDGQFVPNISIGILFLIQLEQLLITD